MDFKKDISRYSPLAILFILGVIVFFLLRPILAPIVWGLILAYLFFPVYSKIHKITKSKNLSAFIVLLIAVLIIAVPLALIIPPLIMQAFQVVNILQTLDLSSFLTNLIPTASAQFNTQISNIFNSFISKLGSTALNFLASFLLGSINVLIYIFITGFVFFYGLRDNDKLIALAKDLSPLSKHKEKVVISQFKEVTNSLIYGQVLVGIVQGILAGIGFLIFGVPNALVLTVVAIVLSVIPIIGPFFVWIPVAVFLFISDPAWVGITFVLYNIFIVSTADNILRTYIVSRRINLSSGIVFVGMMGGLFFFGLLGIIIGPLFLSYFITFLQSYKEETKFRLVKEESEKEREQEGVIPFFSRKK